MRHDDADAQQDIYEKSSHSFQPVSYSDGPERLITLVACDG